VQTLRLTLHNTVPNLKANFNEHAKLKTTELVRRLLGGNPARVQQVDLLDMCLLLNRAITVDFK